MNEKIKELIEYIKSSDWIEWSCGRSTDYIDEFWEEGSVDNLVARVEELLEECIESADSVPQKSVQNEKKGCGCSIGYNDAVGELYCGTDGLCSRCKQLAGEKK